MNHNYQNKDKKTICIRHDSIIPVSPNDKPFVKYLPLIQQDNMWNMFEIPSKHVHTSDEICDYDNEPHDTNNVLLNTGCSLPTTFDSKAVPNMSHREKVNNWIDLVPVRLNQCGSQNIDCFTTDYPLEYEELEFDMVKYHTPKRGAKFSFPSTDDLLEFQSRKIDCLVRKIYSLESDDEYEDSD